jgi:hypothetical protein
MDIVSETLIWLIIIGSFIVGVANLVDILRNSKKRRRFSDVGWAKWTYIVLGFYWTVVYTILVFLPEGKEYVFTSTYIRPSTVVLVFLLLLANQKPVYLPDLIKDVIKKLKNKGEKKVYGKS